MRALNDKDLYFFVKKLKIKNFRGIFMRDELPKYSKANECGIINLDDDLGTHWVAYKIRDSKVEYFNSFGNLAPPKEFIHYVRNAVSIEYNRWRYQHFNSVNCGHLCLAFLSNNLQYFKPLIS